MKKLIAALLILVLTLSLPMQTGEQRVQAASKFIKVNDFITSLVTELDLSIDKSKEEPYITAALSAGILIDGEFKKYSGYLTRTDVAVLINRADEYLNGDKVDANLLNIILKKRISDIKKVTSSKRKEVAKCFAKGIIKGYSNGYYIQSRSFKGSGYVTKSTAKSMIDLILNPKNRAKISHDGMLIRTTNLPKNASEYEYILACYPNKFYEKKFEFMLIDNWKKELELDDYAFPVQMKNRTFRNWYKEWPLKDEMDKYLYDWAALAEKYLYYVFNVDYRTVDDKWIKGLSSVYVKSNIDMEDMINTYYINLMKANHVIVESSIIAVEPSTFYEDEDYCMRAYVKYRITADDMSVKQSKLIYSQYPALDNLKSGQWRTGIFDIRFATNNGSSGDGSDFAIDLMTHFIDAYNVTVN